MTESGQASEEDFVEYQLVHENTVVGGSEEDPVVESDPSNIPDPLLPQTMKEQKNMNKKIKR